MLCSVHYCTSTFHLYYCRVTLVAVSHFPKLVHDTEHSTFLRSKNDEVVDLHGTIFISGRGVLFRLVWYDPAQAEAGDSTLWSRQLSYYYCNIIHWSIMLLYSIWSCSMLFTRFDEQTYCFRRKLRQDYYNSSDCKWSAVFPRHAPDYYCTVQ